MIVTGDLEIFALNTGGFCADTTSMKESTGSLKAHAVWIVSGVVLALAGEMLWVWVAVSRNQTVGAWTLGGITLAAFAAAAGVNFVAPRGSQQSVVTAKEADRAGSQRTLAA